MSSQYVKRPIEPMQYARNGKYPDAFFQAALADHANHCALVRLKQFGPFFSEDAIAPSLGIPSPRTRWRFAFRSGPYASALLCRAWIAQTNNYDAGTPVPTAPYVRVRVQDTTPTTLGDAELSYGSAQAEANTPDTYGEVQSFVASSPGTVAVLAPNTAYRVTVSDVDRARCVSLTVWEVALNVAAPFAEGYAVKTPILDTDREQLVLGARLMWKQAGAFLWPWSVDRDAVVRTRVSATPINVIDNASTTVAADKPGKTIDLRYRTTQRRGTVPVELAVYGSSAGATGGTVYLRNSAGGAVISIGGIKTLGWYTATADLPATLAKYDLHFAGDGVNTLNLYAASLYQYATGS